ncbi:MAG: dihydrodipicolinate reductase [Acidobacteria bacterium]|nr:dihydrodipicolinate reductase [Acidobacteriota bacterium]
MPKRLAIIGYGKMGHMIEQLAAKHDFEVALRVDQGERPGLAGIDVAVEFTAPGAVAGNVEWLAMAGVPVVVGTTGWLDEMERVKATIARLRTGLVWSPNFSVGVNVFSRIVEAAARLMKDEAEYGAWAWEMHHAAKQDAPSGTLLKLVEEMRRGGYEREISVSSNRAGRAPGTHEVGFDSAADTITLRHTARSREGFAMGALRAAQWIIGRRGFYEFKDVIFGGEPCSPAAVLR